jgi:hypothetical protein
MHDVKKIETSILLVMLAAHSSDFGRELTVGETIDGATTSNYSGRRLHRGKNEENPRSREASIYQ